MMEFISNYWGWLTAAGLLFGILVYFFACANDLLLPEANIFSVRERKRFRKSISDRLGNVKFEYVEPFRWIRQSKKYDVVEVEPSRRTILDHDEHKYIIQFPYIIFVFDKGNGSLRVAFSKDRHESSKQLVWFPSINNVYPDWRLCQKGSRNIEQAIGLFWQTTFYTHKAEVNDVRGDFKGLALCNKYFGGIKKWQNLPLDDVYKRMHWPAVAYDRFLYQSGVTDVRA